MPIVATGLWATRLTATQRKPAAEDAALVVARNQQASGGERVLERFGRLVPPRKRAPRRPVADKVSTGGNANRGNRTLGRG